MNAMPTATKVYDAGVVLCNYTPKSQETLDVDITSTTMKLPQGGLAQITGQIPKNALK